MPAVERLTATCFLIPTPGPESDGTFVWDSTALVLAETEAAGITGLGHTYAVVIREHLAGIISGRSAMDIEGAWNAMVHAVCNLGRPGIASMAIAVVDDALWDLRYVDANGAYTTNQALMLATRCAESSMTLFEEPVVSENVPGLCLLRHRAPAGMAIATGEYRYDPGYFRRMIDGESVEYFFDHARVERMLFDGALEARAGMLHPDASRPGLGLELKRADAARYAA